MNGQKEVYDHNLYRMMALQRKPYDGAMHRYNNTCTDLRSQNDRLSVFEKGWLTTV
jgi:hypothetical protein